MKFSTIAAFASISTLVIADDSITYVDVTTTPQVTTSAVKTINSTSTPYTTTTLSTSSLPGNTSTVTSCDSSSHGISSFEGAAANQKIGRAGLGALAGGLIMAIL